MSQQELQLKKLLQDTLKVINKTELETCSQWIDREIQCAKKLQEQIERLQNHRSISAKLFNESRDTCDQIGGYIQRLRDHRSNRAKNGHLVILESPDDVRRTAMLKNASYDMEFKSPF